MACYEGNINLVHLLLENHRHHCNHILFDQIIQTDDKEGPQGTALHAVCDGTENFISIVKMLVNYGADINILNGHGNTVLHTILYNNMMQPHKFHQFNVQGLIEDCHADFLVIRVRYRMTPWECYCGYRSMFVKKRRPLIYASLRSCQFKYDKPGRWIGVPSTSNTKTRLKKGSRSLNNFMTKVNFLLRKDHAYINTQSSLICKGIRNFPIRKLKDNRIRFIRNDDVNVQYA
jgi:Ankyrin repeat